MAEVGIIGETERVELIDGALVEMSPEGPDHGWIISTLNRILHRTYPEPYMVRVQNTLPVGEHKFVEPDLMVVRAHPRGTFPHQEHAVLVIEVAMTSLAWDRDVKPEIYAAWGVPNYWVFDVNAGAITVNTDPTAGAYRASRTYRGDERIALPEIDASIAVDDILVG